MLRAYVVSDHYKMCGFDVSKERKGYFNIITNYLNIIINYLYIVGKINMSFDALFQPLICVKSTKSVIIWTIISNY